LDLDNRWSYLKTHGDPSWETYPSYLETVIPRVLDILERRKWKITFFIVGKDAAEPRNHDVLRSLADAGHEIGNHSFHHEPWLPSYERAEIEREIAEAEDAIQAATGKLTRGFRGPGFCTSPVLLDVLKQRGYIYDASSLPTFIGPLARLYYFATSRLSPEERKRRSALFGGVKDALRPLRAHRVSTASGDLIEIPVTTFPGLRIPIHLSYVMYLATFSRSLALWYFKAALGACRVAGVAPSILLHPLDFLGNDDVSDLGFFPGMRWGGKEKLAVAERALDLMDKRFEIVNMSEHAGLIGSLFPPLP
jgi:hypothetical protein